MKTSEQFIGLWNERLLSRLPVDSTVLVAGASGLIGSSVVRTFLHCPKHVEVYALGRNLQKLRDVFAAYAQFDNLHFIEADISYPLKSDLDFDFIIDCASNANPMAFSKYPVETIKANVYGVDNLLSYGKNHHLQRFLYVSSGEVYGESQSMESHESDSGYVDCTNPRACYPTSKRTAENLCIAYKAEYGLDVVIARPCHTYGPFFLDSDDRAYAQFLRKAVSGQDIILNSPGLLNRSWCYVIDCVNAILYILLEGKTGEAYNISDDSMTIKDFANGIANIADVNLLLNIDKSLAIPIISKGVLNSDKLRSLGWSPINSFESNILATLEELHEN